MYRVQSKRGKPRYTCGTETRSTLWGNPLDPFPPIGENPDNIGSIVPSRGNPRHIPNPHHAGKPALRTNKQHGQGERNYPCHNSIIADWYPCTTTRSPGEVNRETPVFKGDPDVLNTIPIVGNCDEMICRDETPRIYTPGGIRNRPSHRRSQLRWHPLHTPSEAKKSIAQIIA